MNLSTNSHLWLIYSYFEQWKKQRVCYPFLTINHYSGYLLYHHLSVNLESIYCKKKFFLVLWCKYNRESRYRNHLFASEQTNHRSDKEWFYLLFHHYFDTSKVLVILILVILGCCGILLIYLFCRICQVCSQQD